jgi:GDP-4-dehydro-6-deoxy-D-mannose reductase
MPSLAHQILITGATGFVGRHLAKALTTAFPDATLFMPALDVCDVAAVSDVVRTVAPTSCIHLAAISSVAASRANEDRAWQVNLGGTLILARAILQHVPACQLIFASSADAYGASFRKHTRVDESVPLAPLNEYSATKAAADLSLGSMAARGLRVVRLRPFNHTGPGQSSQFVVAAFARQVARIAAGIQKPLLQVGNLDPRRDFLDVKDVSAAYVACVALRNSLEPGMVFNIASGEARRIGDILNELQTLAGISAIVQVDEVRRRTTDVPLACGDATLARRVLGWTISTPWRQTLRDVLDDWRGRVTIEPGAS